MEFALDLIQQTLASPWLYLLIAVIAGLDSLVPIVPSETVVITAAAYAVTGTPHAAGIIAAAALGALLGDLAAHLVGRGGSRATHRWVRSVRLRRILDATQGMFAVRGGAMLVAGRFIPGGRTATTIASGKLGYPVARFLAVDLLGCLAWAVYATGIGLLGGAVFADQPLWGVVLGVAIALVLTGLAEAVRRLRAGCGPSPAGAGADGAGLADPVSDPAAVTRRGRSRLLAAARE